MKSFVLLASALALAACSDSAPPPPAAKVEAVKPPAPVAKAPAPVVKAPEAAPTPPEPPKPDPNKELAAKTTCKASERARPARWPVSPLSLG